MISIVEFFVYLIDKSTACHENTRTKRKQTNKIKKITKPGQSQEKTSVELISV
jgi:hypothetical protein